MIHSVITKLQLHSIVICQNKFTILFSDLLALSTLKMLMFLATLLVFIISRSSSLVTSLLLRITER